MKRTKPSPERVKLLWECGCGKRQPLSFTTRMSSHGTGIRADFVMICRKCSSVFYAGEMTSSGLLIPFANFGIVAKKRKS